MRHVNIAVLAALAVHAAAFCDLPDFDSSWISMDTNVDALSFREVVHGLPSRPARVRPSAVSSVA
jgi:hypothetical protein